jgi:hypothetical protein
MRYSSFWNLLFFTSLMIGFPPTTTISPLGAVFQNGLAFTVPLTFSSCSLDNSRETISVGLRQNK